MNPAFEKLYTVNEKTGTKGRTFTTETLRDTYCVIKSSGACLQRNRKRHKFFFV